MKRPSQVCAGVLVALVVGSGGVLASCGLIVGVGDYAVGDAGADATTGVDASVSADVTAERHDEANVPLTDAPLTDAALAEAALVDASLPDSTPPDAFLVDRISPDATTDAVADSPRESADEQASNAGPDSNPGDASDAHSASEGSPDAEAGPNCGEAVPTGAADFQQLAGACMLAVSCDPYLFPISLSDCITQNALRAASSFACLSTITSCAGATNSFYSCEGARYATTSECPALNSACDMVNSVAINCKFTDITGIVTDCSRTPMSSCQIYDDQGAGSRADCVVVNPCSDTDGGMQCLGNSSYSCVPAGAARVGVGRHCGNATCTTTGPGCQFNGNATCTNPGSATCNGNALQVCTAAGQEFNFDCSRAGGSCVTDGAGTSACVSPGCSPSSTCTESCNATTHELTVCVGGAPFTMSCAQYGFSRCEANSTTHFVYCLP